MNLKVIFRIQRRTKNYLHCAVVGDEHYFDNLLGHSTEPKWSKCG